MRERKLHLTALSRPEGDSLPIGGYDGVRTVHLADDVVKRLRIAAHVEQAVTLPVDIGELGNDVTDDRGMPPHLLDLVLERGELHPLTRGSEIRQRGEDLVDMKCLEPLFDPVRIHHAVAP